MHEPSQIHKKLLPRLSTRLISEFQKRYSEKFGKNISLGEAEAELMELAELIRITSQLSKDMKDINYGKK
jgi:hypothetical protein